MRPWTWITAAVALPPLVLTACGEGSDEASTGLDCPEIEVIVPYSPGGGSDQQVRRLQPAIEDILGVSLNISYLDGGDGAQGWNALAAAPADGCTIGNVVMPNIVHLTETAGEDIGFDAESFEYIAFTETSPNMILVDQDSEWQTFEDFKADAEANPGELSWNGVGSIGKLLTDEMSAATGLELTYVPVPGGVGDMIPQVVGGHVDAAVTGASGLEGGQLRPIVLSTPSDQFGQYGDPPTFEEAGYEGVELETSWGLILPPETPEDIVDAWNQTVQEAMDDPDVQAAYKKTEYTVLNQDAEEARDYFEEQRQATLDASG
jgi:tripartite-type tricarboxylate transporter receptor subunit TctC